MTKIKVIRKDYYKNYINKLDNLEKMGKFQKKLLNG